MSSNTEMQTLEWPGRYLAKPFEWWLREAASGAVGVHVGYKVLGKHEDGEWQDWREFGEYRVDGTVWIVKRDGTVNQIGVDQLRDVLGWDGRMELFSRPVPRGKIQIEVQAEEYKGAVDHRVNWIYPVDAPIGSGTVAPGRQKELANRFGSLLRAAAGGSATPPIAAKAKAPAKPVDDPDDPLPF